MSIQERVNDLSFLAAEPKIKALAHEIEEVLQGQPMSLCLTVVFEMVANIFAQLVRRGSKHEELSLMGHALITDILKKLPRERNAK